MRMRRTRALLFFSSGCIFLFFSVISILTLSPAIPEKLFPGDQRFFYCEGWGCLKIAEYEVSRMENGRITGEKVYLCSFHRQKLHDPLYVPLPWHKSETVGIALLLLFTSLLFFFPGMRTGIPDSSAPGDEG